MGTHPSCPAPTPQVTAKVWVDSFDEDLAHGVNAADQRSQFLIGKATKLIVAGLDLGRRSHSAGYFKPCHCHL